MATAPAYNAHQWKDGEVITAERLNAIETQLAALSAEGGIGAGKIADKAVKSAKTGNIKDKAAKSAKTGDGALHVQK